MRAVRADGYGRPRTSELRSSCTGRCSSSPGGRTITRCTPRQPRSSKPSGSSWYEVEKGTVRSPYDRPVPVRLIGAMAKHRAKAAAKGGQQAEAVTLSPAEAAPSPRCRG